MAQFINIPAKIISGTVNAIVGSGYWSYQSPNDTYWEFGSSPKFYKWIITLSLNEQTHSSPFTRAPLLYTGMDVQVGDYIADVQTGTVLLISSIVSKTDTTLTCEVTDVFRYNTFRDTSQQGVGIFPINSTIIIFEINEDAQPVVDPSTTDTAGTNFYNNISSRFQNLEQNYNFILEKENHGFNIGDVIAVDTANATFIESSANYPYIIGTVSDLFLGPNAFTVNPFEKVVGKYDYLLGEVGSIIYADPINAGGMSLSGNHPIMIKLQDQSNSIVYGTVDNATTYTGNIFNLNNVPITVGGSGTAAISDLISSINGYTSQTGVTAFSFTPPNVLSPTGQPQGFLVVPASASINGTTVNFTTTTLGSIQIANGYANYYDIAEDINSANIPNIVANCIISSSGYEMTITETSGNAITIVNITNDAQGNPFAGNASVTLLPLSSPANITTRIGLEAQDARAINLLDTNGTSTSDVGLVSVENGNKAAAILIDRGIRQANVFVVTNMAARNALSAVAGDQVFVQDTGDGRWGMYLYNFSSQWVLTSDQESAATDALTVEVTIDATSNSVGSIYTITPNRRVSFVTVSVMDAFNGTAPTVTIGDSGDNARLMDANGNDLTIVGDYSATPAYMYTANTDTTINYYFNSNGSTVGNATIAITYT